jgi:hypothetical protein
MLKGNYIPNAILFDILEILEIWAFDGQRRL